MRTPTLFSPHFAAIVLLSQHAWAEDTPTAARVSALEAELSLMKQPDLSGCAGVLTRGVPDIVHLLKSVRSAMYWWWLSFDGHLVCLRLLMVLRASDDVSVHAAMMKAVNAATLRNKDQDSAEIQPRYHRDIAEMRPRYGVWRGTAEISGEMWLRYSRDTAERDP